MPKQKNNSPQQLWEYGSSALVHFTERIFFALGVLVARNPWKTIIASWSFMLLSCIGLMNFHIEKNPMKLWVPPESDFYLDTNWYINKFETNFRLQRVIITADDVMEPTVLQHIMNITKEIKSLEITYDDKEYSLKDLCYTVPIVDVYGSNSNSKSLDSVNDSANNNTNSDDDYKDPNMWIGNMFYCSFVNSFESTCHWHNILDLWNNDINLISSATKHDIIKKVNHVTKNPVTGHPMNYTTLFGGIERDESGDVVSAKSILLTWYTLVNMSDVDINEVGNLVGTEDWVSVPLAMWESKFIELMQNFSQNLTDINLYYEAGRSFADISGEAMFKEIDKLFLGIILMFLYIQFALSRFNWLEIRLTLGSVGLLCIGMAYITTISWCSIMGISFGPVHSSLPFLLMGLGIDDMFVMYASWKNLSENESKKSLPIKVGLMLEHAGVSIVITSFTDIVALLIGAITILPSLKSFCIYAAIGVFFIFCYSVTFYVAIFTLDIRRIQDNRNGILFCYKHSKDISISKNETIFQRWLTKFYKNIVFTSVGRTTIILFVIVMTGFSTSAIFKLEQRFDPKWFIPDGTYYKDYLTIYDTYYPDEGHLGMAFLGEMNYRYEFPNLYNLSRELQNQSYIDDVSTWVDSFYKYVLRNFEVNLMNTTSATDEEFDEFLSKFLYSSIGGRFQPYFRFTQPLRCGYPVTNITGSSMQFKFERFNGPKEYIPAMNHVKGVVKSAPISTGDGYRSVWSKVFANWVTDEIIATEVERNIELALLCVMVCTIILITNLQMCFWIFLCVLLTIVNVLGWMQRWDMTVDIVCCIGLELAIGLCVDYAAHIGHTFLIIRDGNRTTRALKTVTSIGAAVLLGGGSTFLSLSLLSMSKTYTFQSFFKIFLLVIIFGLFNGLLFLPVVLSLIGPDPHISKKESNTMSEIMELNGKEHVEGKQTDDG
ncbi:NPC1-like intracellular cholesterol transporter 1 [Achroia grisella]|uniref:NPC1-like intracellular cholesterol transporter 1 n=1 Tax=Achroia grisella TaxID=688607 RepID=UPI0027D2E624|nr:NPC1-like intracellular cholesterol transporter 1 [Achroia grisella]